MRALVWGNSKQLNKSWPGEANVANVTSNFYDFPKGSAPYIIPFSKRNSGVRI